MAASWARHNLDVLGLVVTFADVLVFALLALFAFHHLPHPREVGWRRQLPGAALVGAGITGVQIFLAYYLAGRLERTPALYGTLGAAVVVLAGLVSGCAADRLGAVPERDDRASTQPRGDRWSSLNQPGRDMRLSHDSHARRSLRGC